MILRQATVADVPALTRLELSFPRRQRWSADAWLQEITAEDRLVQVADIDGVNAAATWQCVDDVTDLHRIAVAAGCRRAGLASQLLTAGLEWASVSGSKRVLLEVAEDNDAAIGLYRAHGFRQIARRRDYYAPGCDALMMELPLEVSGLKDS